MRTFLSAVPNRSVLPGMIIALMPVAIGFARADTITTFDVSGTAMAISGQSCGDSCPFSGTLTVDVTRGIVTAGAFTFPETEIFNSLEFSGPTSGEWEIVVRNPSGYGVFLFFATMPNPESLVGFTGGTIFVPSGVPDLFDITSSSITPAAVPEPSTLMLLGPVLLRGLWLVRQPRASTHI